MKPWQKVALVTGIAAAFTLPLFRSGGRTGLTFFGWVLNHSVLGPAVEYIPEEDYMRELEGVAIATEQADIPQLMAFYQISEESAAKLANRGR